MNHNPNCTDEDPCLDCAGYSQRRAAAVLILRATQAALQALSWTVSTLERASRWWRP